VDGDLPSRASPDLAEDTGGNDEPRTRPQRFSDERTHSRVAALERDEGAGI
jgi:hypothetical protein